jgi:transcription initiation factor TFIIF subunit beta
LNLIFAAFEEKPHYNLKALINRTQQPQTWLKEVLGETCILHKRGPLAGLYELRPEFKIQQDVKD